MNYGSAPFDLGHYPLSPTEMMFYLYLPVKMAGSSVYFIPPQLKYLAPVLVKATSDANHILPDFVAHNVYITAKTLWVENGFSGNRPGWHVDGFGSDGDLNYIWYNENPTEFAVQNFKNISDNDEQSMIDMANQVDDKNIVTYPCGHVMRLDEGVVHRVNPNIKRCVRTFIKISISKHRFNLAGNSHNYMIPYKWDMIEREEKRNMDVKKV